MIAGCHLPSEDRELMFRLDLAVVSRGLDPNRIVSGLPQLGSKS